MSGWLAWLLLSGLTGNPLLAAVILLAGGWIADRYTLGLFPRAFGFVRRWRREMELRRLLANNTHDRRARAELADLLIQRRSYLQALGLLKTNIEAGDEDPNTLFLMGLACMGTGHLDQGELFLKELDTLSPEFRLGASDLERGRWRLHAGNAKGAIEALENFCRTCPGTVEGRVLLSRAYQATNDDVKAAYLKRDAWREFVAAPRFQRRRDRLWAWRAKPSRPIAYALVLLGLLLWAGAYLQGHMGPRMHEPDRYDGP